MSYFVRFNTTTGNIIGSGHMDNAFIDAENAESGGIIHTDTMVTNFATSAVDISTGLLISIQPIAAIITSSQLIAKLAEVQQRLLHTGITVNVAAPGDPVVNILCDGTSATRADLTLLALYGQVNPTGTKTWVDNNNIATVLTGTEMIRLATLIGNWITDTYATLADNTSLINNSIITSYAQINGITWPTSRL